MLEDVENREWFRSHIKLEVRVVEGGGEHRLVHVLREECSHILGSDIKEGSDGKAVVVLGGLVDLVGTVAIWIEWFVIACIVDMSVEVNIVFDSIRILWFKCARRIRQVGKQVLATPVIVSLIHWGFVDNDALWVGKQTSTSESWWRLG